MSDEPMRMGSPDGPSSGLPPGYLPPGFAAGREQQRTYRVQIVDMARYKPLTEADVKRIAWYFVCIFRSGHLGTDATPWMNVEVGPVLRTP